MNQYRIFCLYDGMQKQRIHSFKRGNSVEKFGRLYARDEFLGADHQRVVMGGQVKWQAHQKGVLIERVVILQRFGNLRGQNGGCCFNVEASKISAYRGAPFFIPPL